MFEKEIKTPNNSYSFNQSGIPYPEVTVDKIKPPRDEENENAKSKIEEKKEELTIEEQMQRHMDAYRKAERIVVINFYTGGGAYKKGVLDAIYRGFNPLNP